MRPVTRRRPEAGDPMHRQAAVSAVEDEHAEIELEVGLHSEELQSHE